MKRICFHLSWLLGFMALNCPAQDLMRLMFNQDFEQAPGYLDLGYSYAPDQSVIGQDSDVSFINYSGDLILPFSHNDHEAWYVLGGNKTTRFNSDIVLPDTGRELPSAFYEPYAGLAYRRKLENDWIFSGVFEVGSASDKPFDTWEEYTVDFTTTLQTPIENGKAWLFFLNFSANREFAPGVPLPGFAYYWKPDETFITVAGLPFTMIFWHPVKPVTLQASWFPVRNVDTTLSLYFGKDTALYTGFYWQNDQFLLSGRNRDEDRLDYYRKEIRLGLRHDFNEAISIDTYAGYQFDRFLFEGEDWDDRGYNRVELGESPVFAINTSWKF